MKDKREELDDCLKALHVRYNRKIGTDYPLLLKAALKDFEYMMTWDIPKMFAAAYRQHESRFMPNLKQLKDYWDNEKKKELVTIVGNGCDDCLGGIVHAYQENVCKVFRCSCAAGQSYSHRFLTWHERFKEKGFIRTKDGMSPKIKEILNG